MHLWSEQHGLNFRGEMIKAIDAHTKTTPEPEAKPIPIPEPPAMPPPPPPAPSKKTKGRGIFVRTDAYRLMLSERSRERWRKHREQAAAQP